MTKIGIVGTGRTAALHAEATRAVPGVRLAGMASSRPKSRQALETAAGLRCKVMGLQDLARRCDAVVIATTPAARFETARSIIASPRVRAVLLESPIAATLDEAGRLQAALADSAAMTGANLLHAPAVQQFLTATADMHPHHLELRLAVPVPEQGPETAQLCGGVMTNPGAEFWPVLLAALGTAVESVSVLRMLQTNGIEHTAEIVLNGRAPELNGDAAGIPGNVGRSARAEMRWGARVAECSIEAADAVHVARTEVWPMPTTEIDGEAQPTRARHRATECADSFPLAALGFVAQIQRLARVCTGESVVWPGLDVGRSALAVAVAAALSARRGGESVRVYDAPRDASTYDILSG